MNLAADVVAALRMAGASVATAESLTGGRLCAALVDVPGASDVVLGGIVAYTAEAKTGVLGVDQAILDEFGTVGAATAAAMGQNARRQFDSTYALSTTGVAGPEPSEGKAVGTVFIALASANGIDVRALALDGGRDAIRNETVLQCLSLLLATLKEESQR